MVDDKREPQLLEIVIPISVRSWARVEPLTICNTLNTSPELIQKIRSKVEACILMPPEQRGKVDYPLCEVGLITVMRKG